MGMRISMAPIFMSIPAPMNRYHQAIAVTRDSPAATAWRSWRTSFSMSSLPRVDSAIRCCPSTNSTRPGAPLLDPPHALGRQRTGTRQDPGRGRGVAIQGTADTRHVHAASNVAHLMPWRERTVSPTPSVDDFNQRIAAASPHTGNRNGCSHRLQSHRPTRRSPIVPDQRDCRRMPDTTHSQNPTCQMHYQSTN